MLALQTHIALNIEGTLSLQHILYVEKNKKCLATQNDNVAIFHDALSLKSCHCDISSEHSPCVSVNLDSLS